MFRHFISQQQVQNEFLPAAAFDSLLSRLEGTGLHVVLTALDSEVVVEGTASQFQSALGTGIDTFTNGTYSYYATAGPSTFEGAYVYASNATLLFTKPATATSSSPDSNVTFTGSTFSATQLQPVYNATYYYSHGETGAGQTIGLLDFYGSPTIASDLSLFDSTFGLPNPTLNVIPVGPYDPSLGANVGWSSEISLDVEVSHAMAPGAAIDLYVANGALPLSVPLAKIVQDDKVTTLSQSFGNYEWYYSITSFLGGPSFMALNALIPDQYYALGSAEGITFSASTGDGGGSGYSSGPEGNLEYPATSPFVTAVGGTQTYFSATQSGSQSFKQTAWSNIGYVPNLVNQGGGGGGVSILEPKPWYQSQQSTPLSYPDGRLNPDVSLQAGTDPATTIVDSGKLIGIGGTSESSPLLAGLLTLVAQSLKGHLGLVNPFLYKVGNDAAEYQKGFAPITFGYITPWTASYGYNLATGWGSPNIGELGLLLNSTKASAHLNVAGEILNSSEKEQAEFTPGEQLMVNARITEGGSIVSTGSFSLSLQTLTGDSLPSPMSYDIATGNWTGAITMGQQSGLAYVFLNGSASDGVSGQALGTIFAGYLGSLTVYGSIYSLSFDPWTWTSTTPLSLSVITTDLQGKFMPAGSVSMHVEPYSITYNRYDMSSPVTLNGSGSGTVSGSLTAPAPDGPVSLVLQGDVYGYAPTVYGIYLQTSYIYPDVAAEPGSAAPGQYLTIITTPIAPVNVYFETSRETGRSFAYDVSVGSNVTASLVSPSGMIVSTADLAYQACAQALRICNGGANVIYGQLQVPIGSPSGLYTVKLDASYGSLTAGGNITGSFYGQVWVSSSLLAPVATVGPGPVLTTSANVANATGLYEGERAHLQVALRYSNGTSVQYGEFSAVVYPQSLQGQYTSLMHTQYAAGDLVPLSYDPVSGFWVGNFTVPSSQSQGVLQGLGLNNFDYSGPYDVYVTGLSADGAPTTSALNSQWPFFVEPYTFTQGTFSFITQGSQLAFSSSKIIAWGNLSGDIFLDNNTVQGARLTITGSQIRGTLYVVNSNLTVVGVSGGSIVATNSTLTMKDSTVDSLNLTNSHVSLVDSSYAAVTPALPVITVGGLSKPIGGRANFTVSVFGSALSPSSITASADGNAVSLTTTAAATSPGQPSNITVAGTIDAAALNDGVHTLLITATQADGLSSTLSTSFSTDAHQLSLQSQTSSLFDYAYLIVVLSLAALAVGLIALMRGRGKQSPTSSAVPQV
jgi:subtilase family serine protease